VEKVIRLNLDEREVHGLQESARVLRQTIESLGIG